MFSHFFIVRFEAPLNRTGVKTIDSWRISSELFATKDLWWCASFSASLFNLPQGLVPTPRTQVVIRLSPLLFLGIGVVDWLKAEFEAVDNSYYGVFYTDDLTDESRAELIQSDSAEVNSLGKDAIENGLETTLKNEATFRVC